ncbi:uncharacterized protein LOC128233749 isoform X2 [Mya arenaria]|nr:uncharacterized protein LOC128233749 isoform X2 [Mya arenaria]
MKLEVDKNTLQEYSALTINCTIDKAPPYLLLIQSQAKFTNDGKNNCNVTFYPNSILSHCDCVSDILLSCVSKRLNRTNHGDVLEYGVFKTEIKAIIIINITVPVEYAKLQEDTPDRLTVDEGNTAFLVCQALYGIPAANITWFVDNKILSQTDNSLSTSYNISERIKEEPDRTLTVISSLTLKVNRSHNKLSSYCTASNVNYENKTSRMIQLNVRFKPTTGILISGDGNFYMIQNSPTKQRLECFVKGGNPYAMLHWSCYDGNQTTFNDSMGANSTIMWEADFHNDSICNCSASHVLGWSRVKEVYVHALYPPYEPTCEIGMATVRSGSVNISLASKFTMTCKSDSMPEPGTLIWTLPSGYFLNGSTLHLPFVHIDDSGIYNLYIENTMSPSIGATVNGKKNATFNLNVHYHPKNILFRFDNESGNVINTRHINVIKGEIVTLVCVADGHPPPMYTWTDNNAGQFYTQAFTNDLELVCNASNTLFPTGYVAIEQQIITSAKLQVDVLYPTTPPVFQTETCKSNSFEEGWSIKVLRGKKININCSSSGNPPPSYSWSNGLQSSQLYIHNVSERHAVDYFCTANNIMDASYGRSISSSNTSRFHLDVLYPPKITNFTSNVEVLEGVNVSLICNATPGNPNITSYYWTTTNQTKQRIYDRYLFIQNISRTEEDVYTCLVQNSMDPTGCQGVNGSDTASIHVDVQYEASIKSFAVLNTTVYHSDSLSLACDVDSDPPANITIVSPTGSTLAYIEGNSLLHYNKSSSCLTDIGLFTCVSANKHNRMTPDRRNVTVDVKCSPRYPTDYNHSATIDTRPGEKAVLNFSVFSNPPPTQFTWTNISNSMQIPVSSTAADRVSINSIDNMSSSLIITNVEPWDFGNYSVRVENEVGSLIETFHIIAENKSIPNGPSTTSITRNGLQKTHNIGVVVGGSVGAVSGVVLTLVVVIIVFYTRRKKHKGTPQHDNNKLQLLQDTRHKSEKTEMESFTHVLPINDESSKYEEEKNIYGNVQTKDASGKSLAIKTLRETVRTLKLDPVPLFKEFYTLQMGLQYNTKDALKPNNVAKNRYRSVYPYDASRVVLPWLSGDPDSDFINASYIDGYCKPRKYIAAQGPLENTISDTWRMIHSEDVKIIVMVTNLLETGKRKCFKYWPDDRATYGKCYVKLDQVEEFADFVVRNLTYSMEGSQFERQLIQFHYTSWPDKNVPSTALSLVQFWRKVRQSVFVDKTPWMVHCSAGVGRTGTFIALDYLFDQGKVDGKLNIPETVNVLREQRISMVQTKEQYLYLHEAITELLDPVGQIFTPGNSLRLRSTATEERKLKKEFKAITTSIVNVKSDFEENDYDSRRMPDGLLPENICKSIDKTVIPDDLFRPLISTGNDFINAVFIPTYRDAEKYIVTQYPLQNTVLDFVRLLWDHSIEDVVLLDVGDEKLHCYWPQNKGPLCIGPFLISLLSVDEEKNCTIRRIDISLAERRQNKETVVHQFTAWPGYLNLCEPKPLTEFLQTISRIAGPVVVQCHDGYSRSGVFAALLSIVDRIKTDKEVAIADTVRVVKHRRQAAITDVEQYQFCHEVIFEYLKGRETQTEEKENQEYINMTFPKFL